jgi:vanillate O-demethylase monooxygenase subunit
VRCGYPRPQVRSERALHRDPGLERVPEQARVRTYPVAVKNKWIFVWMGDPLKADVALLPDNFSCDHPTGRTSGYLHYDTDYLLICDNLLDFSHLSYVHREDARRQHRDRAGARADRAGAARHPRDPARP